MNILGLSPDVYRARWAEFGEVIETANIGEPADQALFWREMTGTRHLVEWPVPIDYFLSNPYYVGTGLNVRPLIGGMLGDFWSIDSQAELLLFIGGLGTGKSYSASLSLAYGLYLLSVMRDPIAWLNRFPGVSLSSGSEIVLLNASAAGAEQSDKIVYGDVLERVSKSPYFQEVFPPKPNKRSELIFPNRVRYAPGTSDWRTALGWNVFGYAIDEAAFGKETERADYVAELFKALNQRRRSRFGLLGFGFMMTSPGHDAAYVETLSRQGESWDTSMMVVRMNTWDSKEELAPGAGVFVFDRHRDSMRIVARDLTFMRPGVLADAAGEIIYYDGEPVSEEPVGDPSIPGLSLSVIPNAYLAEFRRDPSDSMLKYGALPQRAHSPWYIGTESIRQCMSLPDYVSGPSSVPRLLQQYPDVEWRAGVAHPSDDGVLLGALADGLLGARNDWGQPWHVHIDPGLNRGRRGDCAGIAVGRILDQARVDHEGTSRIVNRYVVPLAMQIVAPEAGEIFLTSLSKFVILLRSIGIRITSFSYDAFGGFSAIQELTRAGMVTAGIKVDDDGMPSGFGKPFSVDRTSGPHQDLKEAINEGRILLPDYWILRHELEGLEHIFGKAPNHPSGGSKDCADAVAGVVGYLAQFGHFQWVTPSEQTVSMTDIWADQDADERQRSLEEDPDGARLVID